MYPIVALPPINCNSMLKFSCTKVVINDSVGSTYTLRVQNSSSTFSSLIIKSSHPHLFRVCDQSLLCQRLDPQEEFDIVIEMIKNSINLYEDYFVCIGTGNDVTTIPVEFKTVDERSESPDRPSNAAVECQICFQPFDENERVPRIVKECGHTLCQRCCQHLMIPNKNRFIICPVDRTSTVVYESVNNLPKNFTLMQVISESNVKITKTGPPFCITHKKQKLFFVCTEADCSSNRKLMCGECMLEDGPHEGHSYISSKKFFENKKKFEEDLDATENLMWELMKKHKEQKTRLEKVYSEKCLKVKEMYDDVMGEMESKQKDLIDEHDKTIFFGLSEIACLTFRLQNDVHKLRRFRLSLLEVLRQDRIHSHDVYTLAQRIESVQAFSEIWNTLQDMLVEQTEELPDGQVDQERRTKLRSCLGLIEKIEIVFSRKRDNLNADTEKQKKLAEQFKQIQKEAEKPLVPLRIKKSVAMESLYGDYKYDLLGLEEIESLIESNLQKLFHTRKSIAKILETGLNFHLVHDGKMELPVFVRFPIDINHFTLEREINLDIDFNLVFGSS
ncbi:hypothetical protein B9Z55_006071 [Caenorhabditis nigoni]|uniref:RING-type domain-containing protein n=1 Tax=Caenorhabditis nigoni TaxID=1611254 RepID=A0A2G5V3I3_9PELO|nr:hypothetical protein B9Z55_006071 [Caenorhabditis nigoni]